MGIKQKGRITKSVNKITKNTDIVANKATKFAHIQDQIVINKYNRLERLAH